MSELSPAVLLRLAKQNEAAGGDRRGVMGMAHDFNLKVMQLRRFDNDGSKLKAFVDVAVGDFMVKGLRILQGQKGLFLAMPQEQGKDGKWYNAFYPLTKEARQSLSDMVLAAYAE